MGIGHVKEIMEAEDQYWSAAEHHVALVAAYHADRKGVVRVSQVELAEATRLSPKTVSRAMEMLCDLGVFVKLGHGRYGLRYGVNKQVAQPAAPQNDPPLTTRTYGQRPA